MASVGPLEVWWSKKARMSSRRRARVRPQETESAGSDQPKCQHGVGDLGKAGDIRHGNVVAGVPVLVAVARQRSWIPGMMSARTTSYILPW